MYSCFENLIGIDGCSVSNPDSGLWLNGKYGLPSVDLATASSVVDSETQTGINLLVGSRYRAILETISDAKSELSKYYQFNNIAEVINYNGLYNTYTGVQDYTFYNYDDLLQLSIKTMQFRSATNSTKTLTIIEDGISRTISVVCLSNQVTTVTINALAQSTLEFNIDLGTDIFTSGKMFANFTLKKVCSDDAFWCNFKQELGLAIQYKAGYNVMHEIASTNRFNGGFSKEVAVANMSLWYGTYNSNNGKFEGGEYQKYLESAINSIKNGLNSINSCCLTCNKPKMVYVKP